MTSLSYLPEDLIRLIISFLTLTNRFCSKSLEIYNMSMVSKNFQTIINNYFDMFFFKLNRAVFLKEIIYNHELKLSTFRENEIDMPDYQLPEMNIHILKNKILNLNYGHKQEIQRTKLQLIREKFFFEYPNFGKLTNVPCFKSIIFKPNKNYEYEIDRLNYEVLDASKNNNNDVLKWLFDKGYLKLWFEDISWNEDNDMDSNMSISEVICNACNNKNLQLLIWIKKIVGNNDSCFEVINYYYQCFDDDDIYDYMRVEAKKDIFMWFKNEFYNVWIGNMHE